MSVADKMAEPFKTFSIGHYFKLGNDFYRVKNVDWLDVKKTFVVGPNTESGYTSIDEVSPEVGQIYGFLIGVKGPGKVHVKQPSAVAKWGSKVTPTVYISEEESPYLDPQPGTFCVTVKDRTININVKNELPQTTTTIVRFIGYKYQVEMITNPESKKKLEALFAQGKIPELTIEGFSR